MIGVTLGSRVLVTGAGGVVGSVLCRQVGAAVVLMGEPLPCMHFKRCCA